MVGRETVVASFAEDLATLQKIAPMHTWINDVSIAVRRAILLQSATWNLRKKKML